jgi:uncharacterized protein
MDKKIVMFCLCALIAIFAIASVIFAASFDCGKAKTEVEKLICSGDELSKLDESLSEAYLQALKRTDIKQQTIKSQRQWLKNVRNVCQNAECIKNAYETRIKELGFTSSFGIIIFRDPNRKQLPTKTIAEAPKSQVTEPSDQAAQTQTGQQYESVTGSVNDTSVVKNLAKLILTCEVSALAGSRGSPGFKDGSGEQARFNYPFGITTDGTNLYVSETNNHTIRKIVIATGMVSTLAGSAGKRGAIDGMGRAARFNVPYGLATDGTNLYVTEVGNNDIRKIVIATGKVTTLAGTPGRSGSADGTGIYAQFSFPFDITIVSRNLYVTDHYNATIRRIVIATCEVTTLAGTAKVRGATDGIGSNARFYMPAGITTDGSNLYVADTLNRNIRKIVIATGEVTTLAGPDETTCISDGWHGRCPDGYKDTFGTMARFNNPSYITTDGTNLYVTEAHQLIRKIVIATGEVTTLPCGERESGSTAGIMGITNDGTSLYVADLLGNTIIKLQ